ncbi:hypothetical protein BsWGS_10164 [Bradybaena similaris]
MWAVENDLPTAVETLIEVGADVNQTRSVHKHLTPVMVAAEKGYSKIVQLLTESGARVNDHRYDQETPLTIALHAGHLTCIEILINAGADCNYLSPGGRPVMIAVRNNNKDCLEVLVNSDTDVNTPDRWNNTPLTLAVAKNRLDCVIYLLQAGADCNYLSPDGTPVMIALKNNVDILHAFVDNGADVNTPDRWNNTPLTLAVAKSRLDCVNCLLQAGADCNYQSPDGTPVMIAIKNNDSQCLRVLINKGADVNTSDKWGNTPLTFAIQKDYLASIKTLISCGADLNLKSPKGPPLYTAYSLGKLGVAELLLQGGANVDIANSSGHTLLMLAAIRHEEKWVQTLIQAGANANLVSATGRTALILAIRSRAKDNFPYQTRLRSESRWPWGLYIFNDFRESTRKYSRCWLLLQHSTKPNIQDNKGKTALMYCVETDRRHFAELLLVNKADPNIRDNKGKTALLYCVETNNWHFAKLLLDNKADPNIRDNNRKTALLYCVETNNWHFAKLLLDNKADANIRDNKGKTALLYCVERDIRNFAKLLLDNKADANIRDNKGKTALMYCVETNNWYFAELLLDNKADPNIRDNKGKTALLYCVERDISHFAKLLLNNKADPNIRDNYGKTALMYSVLSGGRYFAELLLDNSADPNVQDTEGKTALMHSVDNNCFDMLLSKNVDTDCSDKTHSTALIYLLRILVDRDVLNPDIMHRLCILLRCGVNSIIHPSHRDLLNKLSCTTCRTNNSYHDVHFVRDVKELIRIFVCNGMGSRAKETLPMADHHCKFVFDKRYRSFIRFACYSNNVDIMHYLIATCFLTNTDLTLLREGPREYPNCIMTQQLNKAMSQPWPLVKLSFIAVSTAVGFSCDRQERVSKTQLPPRLQRMLMFQEPVSRLPVSEWADIPLCFDSVAYEQVPKPRPLIYYWPFGRDLIV